MKTIAKHLFVTLSACCPAFATAGAAPEGNGLLVILFLGFGALIIVFQLIPAFMLFLSMVKGLFRKPTKGAAFAGGKAAKID
jgi:hypothetical protein